MDDAIMFTDIQVLRTLRQHATRGPSQLRILESGREHTISSFVQTDSRTRTMIFKV